MSQPTLETELALAGPLRSPRQLLAGQLDAGHASLHDEATAQTLGFRGGAIEGPTHFSQFVPLLAHIWGEAWFETGCLSAHFRNVCVEGDEVRAFVQLPTDDARRVRLWMEKKDGTEVLVGSASVGLEPPESELERRLRSLRPPGRRVILEAVELGDNGAEVDVVKMDLDQHLGDLYPFTLAQKLEVITEQHPWYTADGGAASPWRRPILPIEMVSVLTGYTSHRTPLPVRQPSISLLADVEVRMLAGPLFVGQEYALRREVVAFSESRRTESYWGKVEICDPASGETVATTLVNHALLKESYPGYEEAAARS